LRHYAPNIESYLFDGKLTSDISLGSSVLIDYGSKLSSLKGEAKHYIDMSPRGSCLEAIANIYDVLRWSETREDATSVLIANLLVLDPEANEHKEALFDRIYRATSGK
jgi:hypothetical protein